MKKVVCSALALALVTPGACSAALVTLPVTNDQPPRNKDVFHSTVAGHPFGRTAILRSQIPSFTVQVDTATDVSSVTGMSFVLQGIPQAWNRSISTNFPEPPKTLHEEITLNVDAALQLIASETSPLINQGGDLWRSHTISTMQYPDSFVITGEYKVSGPTQSFVTPFSVTFQRNSPATVLGNLTYEVKTGDNFPATASADATSVFIFGGQYQPVNPIVFEGMVDGMDVTGEFTQTSLWGGVIPEPSGASLAAIGASLLARRRKRVGPAG